MSESLRDQSLQVVMEAIASKQPTPGGGAVAAILAALGAATARMTLNYSTGKKSLAEHKTLHDKAAAALKKLSKSALDWVDEDAEAYLKLNALWKLPGDDAKRMREFPDAVTAATNAPMNVLRGAVELLNVLEQLCGATNDKLNSDFAIAAISAAAALQAAQWNVLINLPLIEDEEARDAIQDELDELLSGGAASYDAAMRHCAQVGGLVDEDGD